MTAFWLSAPLLAIGFIAGIAISLVQIATSMQDNAFSTIPRLLAFLLGLLLLLPWMLQRSMSYTIGLLGDLARYAASLSFPAATLYGFLLVLARVAGALIFVPLPGVKGAPEPVRAALALGFTLACFPAGRQPELIPRPQPWPVGRLPKRGSESPSGSRLPL
jgi:flagellar biosynthesis protein FliQ